MDKKEDLYLRQKALLELFLQKHAISEAQYEKSLGDLTEKMGMVEVLKKMKQEGQTE